jgi:hypothetical protein
MLLPFLPLFTEARGNNRCSRNFNGNGTGGELVWNLNVDGNQESTI